MLGAPVFRTALFGPWSGNALWTAARAVPSLDLCFADKKDLICASSGRQLVTFARASSGTYVDSAGVLQIAATDVPRFDHDPLTGESLGLLVEEQRTNLMGNSGVLTATPNWLGANATLAASGTAPDGNSAYEVTETTATSSHSLHNGGTAGSTSTSVTSGTIYTGSIFLKQSTDDWVQLTFGAGGFGATLFINFNLVTGSIGNSAGCTGTITPFRDGWYRCTITATATTTALSNNLIVAFTNNTNATSRTPSYTGSTARKVFAALGQFEAGAFASSYIPTTTAAATRNADVVQITGTNFSSWYRQDEGTVFAEYIISALVADGTVTSFDDGTANNRWQQRFTTVSQRYRLQSGGVSLVDDASTGAPLVNATNKVAHTIRSGDQRYAGNGALNANVLTASPLPAVTQLQLGAGISAGSAGRIIIRRIAFWPQRFSNATLQAITQP